MRVEGRRAWTLFDPTTNTLARGKFGYRKVAIAYAQRTIRVEDGGDKGVDAAWWTAGSEEEAKEPTRLDSEGSGGIMGVCTARHTLAPNSTCFPTTLIVQQRNSICGKCCSYSQSYDLR